MVGRASRAAAAAAADDGAGRSSAARDDYAAGVVARAAIEADITITHEAASPDADGESLDDL
eukprot:3279016-Prymnesium_polylepis.1